MDKVSIKFFADILYAKEIIYFDEMEAIYDCCTPSDLDRVVERMLGGDYNRYKRGETISKDGRR